jgi:Cof subfamily protein (haloacid dehalogenase superfamily)
MIRLIALDLDGTVLDSHGNIPESNHAAIARAIGAGIEVAIATGRRYEFARAIVERLPSPLTLILSNGAIVKRQGEQGGETLMRRLLPRAAARAALAGGVDHRASAALIFDRPGEGQVIFESIDWNDRRHRLFYEANRPFVSERSPLEDALTEDPVQLMFTGRCDAMRRLFDGLRRAVSGTSSAASSAYSVALTEYERRDFSLVDVMQAGCSKGSTLAAWTARQGLSPSEVMAVGDNLNDLEMLEFAGTPVLMGNAIEELKGRGWISTATNDDGGVARAIETFVLSDASYCK